MKRALFLLLPTLALSACGSEPTTTERSTSAGGERTPDPIAARMPPPAVNTDPVPVPADLIATIRVGSLDGSAAAIRVLLGEATESAVPMREALTTVTGSAELAGLVVTSAGAEVALITAAGEPEVVVAFDGPAMRTAVAAIPRGTLVEPLTDGALLVRAPENAEDGRECTIEPTSNPSRTRIVCAKDIVELESARLYLARNFTESVAAGKVEFDLAVDSLRERYGSDLRAGLVVAQTMMTSMLERVGQGDDGSAVPEGVARLLQSEEVRSKVTTLLRDLLDDVTSLVDDLASLTVDARIDDAGAHVEVLVGIRHPSGSLVRAALESFRAGAAPSAELLARLPPGAALYGVGRSDARPFEEFLGELRDAFASLVHASIQLSQADRDALDRALALLARPRAYSFGSAGGSDANARVWAVTHARFDSSSEAASYVDSFRQAIAILRRPSIARAVDELLAAAGPDGPRVADIAELRLRGVPAGTFAVRMPAFDALGATLASSVLHTEVAASAPRQPQQWMFVQTGADVLIVQANDALATYRGLASAGGLPAAITAPLLEPGWSWALAIRPGNVRLPNQPVDDDAGAPTLESVIGVEAGQAVSIFRMRESGRDGEGRIELQLDMPTAFLRGLASLGRRPSDTQ